jgi:hypothetical protein
MGACNKTQLDALFILSLFRHSTSTRFGHVFSPSSWRFLSTLPIYRGADKSLARPGRKQTTATEDFDVHISCYNHNWRNISTIYIYNKTIYIYKGKGLPQQAEVAQGVPGRLRPRIFLTFRTRGVVGRQPYAPPLPQETSLVLSFRGWVDPRTHGSVGSYGKNPQWLTPPGIGPETVQLVAIYINIYTHTHTTSTNCKYTSGCILCVYIYIYTYIYTHIYIYNTYQLYIYSIPPDDGLKMCPKRVEVEWWYKLGINSASGCFPLHLYIEMHNEQNI